MSCYPATDFGLNFVLNFISISMEIVSRYRWVFAFLVCCCALFSRAYSVKKLSGMSKVRGVNLGGWLVVEGWIKPSLFDGIPNEDMLDGTQVQFKSTLLQKYISAANGGGTNVTVDRDVPSSWETFKATSANQLTADYQGVPGWDSNGATFEMTIVTNNLHGDYQLANGYGHDKAKEILMKHRRSFVTREDIRFVAEHGINTLRIPVGWWISLDPNPPAPFIGGTLEALDNAFSWAQDFNLKCIIDLHAAPGSQNGMEHSASRDGSIEWPGSPVYISQSLDAIDFLSSRYANHPALLGIELLNEPSASAVPIGVLISYYLKGYQIVRKYSSTAYVIFCQRIGNADPLELYQANIGVSNTVVDLHYYNLFDNFYNNMSAMDNIQFIYKSRLTQVQALNNANGHLVFIGEWVNEWNVKTASQAEYQDFGKAQLKVYDEASFGWSYWTVKNARNHWNFEWNILNNFLPLESSSSKRSPRNVMLLTLVCGCFYLYHIL
ncbi:putative glucan 1,3-beta-glucosidase A isoform X5 [Tasmannia lanceolata]|uniref:putative glucan 1,3-beta-glucosidase A isoform X5 n=1 Tax=Tasmannia lanceolata TaxID=3420 RepID=UPI0040649F6D